jgi:hypothetical protein
MHSVIPSNNHKNKNLSLSVKLRPLTYTYPVGEGRFDWLSGPTEDRTNAWIVT